MMTAAEERRRTIWGRFMRFHEQNPHVYDRLEELAQEWFDAGHTKVAVRMLWEVLRWEAGTTTTGEGGYKLNDHFPSRYVRLLIHHHPDWAGRFHTRTLRAA